MIEKKVIVFPTPTSGVLSLDQRLKDFGVHLGVPVEDSTLAQSGRAVNLRVPFLPHVFRANTLMLATSGVVSEQDKIRDAIVMLGHGVSTSYDMKGWVFIGSGIKVNEAVEAYESIASGMGWPPLDVLLICRNNMLLKPREKATLEFETRGIPYIRGNSRVVLHQTYGDKVSNVYKFGLGVDLLIANAEGWNDQTKWSSYWTHRLQLEDVRTIPAWADYPCLKRE